MNTNEQKMLQILKELKDNYNVFSVKAEFEAEGTRTDDLLRLCDLVRRSGLSLTIKIGGCEAISDMHQVKKYGAKCVIAPMIESGYALSKYVDAKNKIFNREEQNEIEFLFNVGGEDKKNSSSWILKKWKYSSNNSKNGIYSKCR